MTFEKAIHDACRELGYDGHLTEIKYEEDAYTYAERIAFNYKKPPFKVKNSYMYLYRVDFCLFEVNGECDFSISGYVHGDDKLHIIDAIGQVLKLCELTTSKMAESECAGMTEDSVKVLRCIMSCEISLCTACHASDKAVVPISNIVSLLKWTKYRVRKALKELRELELIEYTSQGCPAIISYGAESYLELIDDAHPPINGYALTKKAFESELWQECCSEWEKSMEEWANKPFKESKE